MNQNQAQPVDFALSKTFKIDPGEEIPSADIVFVIKKASLAKKQSWPSL